MEARLQRRRSCRNATFSLIAILLIVKTAASSCPPPEEQSLSDVHCPREIHTTQEALDLCYMKVSMAAQPHHTCLCEKQAPAITGDAQLCWSATLRAL